MAINNVKDTQSLLTDIEDWMNNPKFQPQEQNKWFFGEGLSYYTQLCEVVKVLTYLQENFKVVIANEKSLEQAYNEVKDLPNQFNTLSTKVDDLTNTVSDLPRRVQELETKVTKLISDVSSQLTRIETLEGSVSTNTGSITTLNDEVDKIKVKDGEQDVKIEKLQSDVISINAKDISQDSEIASVKSKNQEQDTLIDSNTNKITTLEGKDFLTNVRLENTNSITFQGGEKVDGVQTYTAQVIGSVPVNLGENIAYASNTNIELISAIANPILTETTSNSFIRKKQYNRVKDGKLSTNTFIVENFVNEFFKLTRNDEITLNIDNVLSPTLLLNGSQVNQNPVNDLNNFYTGIGFFTASTLNIPIPNKTNVVISASNTLEQKNQSVLQISYDIDNLDIYYRNCYNGQWNTWTKYVIDNLTSNISNKPLSANQGRILNETKQDKLIFSPTWFVVDGVNVSLKESIFDSYLTKTEASGEYETKANATETYETKANATETYETKANASETYETKANASTTYVSKSEAVGYDDILTNANANTTYETKANANTTYETKAHASETYATKTQLNSKANTSALGTQCTFVLNGTTLTITSK